MEKMIEKAEAWCDRYGKGAAVAGAVLFFVVAHF